MSFHNDINAALKIRELRLMLSKAEEIRNKWEEKVTEMSIQIQEIEDELSKLEHEADDTIDWVG